MFSQRARTASRTLHAQVLAPAIVASLPLALFAAIVVYLLWQQQQAQFEQQQRATVRAIAAAVEREIGATVRQLRLLAASPALDGGAVDAFAEEGQRALAVTPQWRNLVVFDADARQVLNLRFPRPAGPSDEGRRHVQAALESREPRVSNVFTGPSSNRLVTAVTLPVLRDGRAVYALSVTPDFGVLDALLRARATDGAVVSLWDGNMRFIARSIAADEYRGRPPTPEFRSIAQNVSEGLGRVATMEGTGVLSAWTQVRSTPWSVGLGVPSAAADALLHRYLWVLAAAEILILLTAFYFARAAAVKLDREAAERERAEAERDRLFALEREARAAAETASRSKDEFLAMLGHELRNPLGALSNAVQLLEISQARPEDAAFAHSVIARQARHLTRLIDDLLDVGRVITGKIELRRERFDLAAAVESAVTTVRAGHDGAHRVSVRTEPVGVDADRTRIEQVAINLVSNALAHTPAGGNVWISVARDGADAVITVRDDGSGIREEDLARVFDLFFQAKSGLHRKGGLGLGLTLVRRLVELHHGTVSVYSEGAGRGATFTVRLPAAESPAERPPRAALRSGAADARSILVIEDNHDARESLRKVLALDGHTVYEAGDGKSGLAAAGAVKPEIALVDIGLPQMDGYEVARELRKQLDRSITLIALTGYGQPEDQKRALEAGFDAHLVKPADFERLRILLQSLPVRRNADAGGG